MDEMKEAIKCQQLYISHMETLEDMTCFCNKYTGSICGRCMLLKDTASKIIEINNKINDLCSKY